MKSFFQQLELLDLFHNKQQFEQLSFQKRLSYKYLKLFQIFLLLNWFYHIRDYNNHWRIFNFSFFNKITNKPAKIEVCFAAE